MAAVAGIESLIRNRIVSRWKQVMKLGSCQPSFIPPAGRQSRWQTQGLKARLIPCHLYRGWSPGIPPERVFPRPVKAPAVRSTVCLLRHPSTANHILPIKSAMILWKTKINKGGWGAPSFPRRELHSYTVTE